MSYYSDYDVHESELPGYGGDYPLRRKKKYTRKKRTTPKSKRLSLTVKKRGVVWRMVKKFKSKASRLRAKRGLAKKGWR